MTLGDLTGSHIRNLDIKYLRSKKNLLDGVCQEAVDLLKDKIMSENVFRVLKKMKPIRQLKAAMSMNAQNRYSYEYAKSLLVARLRISLSARGKAKKFHRPSWKNISGWKRRVCL